MNDEERAAGARFGALIRAARERMGWTQDELIAASQVSRSTILRWENGHTANPGRAQVRAVLAVLGVDPREAPVALGYVTREEVGLSPEEPRWFSRLTEEAIAILEEGDVPDVVKSEWVAFLRWRVGRDGSARHR